MPDPARLSRDRTADFRVCDLARHVVLSLKILQYDILPHSYLCANGAKGTLAEIAGSCYHRVNAYNWTGHGYSVTGQRVNSKTTPARAPVRHMQPLSHPFGLQSVSTRPSQVVFLKYVLQEQKLAEEEWRFLIADEVSIRSSVRSSLKSSGGLLSGRALRAYNALGIQNGVMDKYRSQLLKPAPLHSQGLQPLRSY